MKGFFAQIENELRETLKVAGAGKRSGLATSVLFFLAGLGMLLFGRRYPKVLTSKHLSWILSTIVWALLVHRGVKLPIVYFVAGGAVADFSVLLVSPATLPALLPLSVLLMWGPFVGFSIHQSWRSALAAFAGLWGASAGLHSKSVYLSWTFAVSVGASCLISIGLTGLFSNLFLESPPAGMEYIKNVSPFSILGTFLTVSLYPLLLSHKKKEVLPRRRERR